MLLSATTLDGAGGALARICSRAALSSMVRNSKRSNRLGFDSNSSKAFAAGFAGFMLCRCKYVRLSHYSVLVKNSIIQVSD